MFSTFKASINVLTGKRSSNKYYDFAPDLYVNGAYKTNVDELFGTQNPPQRTLEDRIPHLRPNKSSADLTRPKPVIPNLRSSVPEISRDPRGAEQNHRSSIQENNTNLQDKKVKSNKEARKAEKEAKKLEKQRIAEQKERDKQAAAAAKLNNDKRGKKVKKNAPQPDKPKANPLAQRPYSTNTLESSISKSSGPPPYIEVPKMELEPSKDNPGVSFSKPIDEGSWDLIAQHKQEISRPMNGIEKKSVMNLKYDTGFDDKDNSEA